jgi:dihydroorotase
MPNPAISMRLLIQSAEITDPLSHFNGQQKDLLIENGILSAIGELGNIEADEVFSHAGLHVSPGWFDMRVIARDPGLEQVEDLYSVRQAAAAGGFTGIALLPNTHPVVQTKEALLYQKSKGTPSAVETFPMAAVTLDNKGIDLTEMIDLHRAGAVAFTDGYYPLQSADMVLKVLQYLQPFGGLFINRPEDTLLTRFGVMNEGLAATRLGLKGMPKMAESIMVMRDLRLLEYTGGKLHLSCISTAESVALIRKARQQGVQVSCDVVAHQLAFEDTALDGFDTFFKVNPPFRNPEDIAALWEGLADQTIDCVVSDHSPWDEEHKKLEFDQAEFGAIGLQTVFSLLNTYNRQLPADRLVRLLSHHPRRILGLPQPVIEVGQEANLSFFEMDNLWAFSSPVIRSKSVNSPLLGKELKGKVLGIVNKGYWYKN